MCFEIDKRRFKIDEIDDELLRLLNERADLVSELAVIKRRHGIVGRDRIREDAVLTRVLEKNGGPLDDAGALRIFRLIIEESCRLQGIEFSNGKTDLAVSGKIGPG